LKQVWNTVLRVLSTIAFILLAWVAAYYILQGIYALIGSKPAANAASLINYTTAIFLMMLTVRIIGFLFRHSRDRMFYPIIESIRRIGKGELSVSVPVRDERELRGPFGELIQSINTMAGELSQIEKMRQEFISNVSHEFQSPLTSIGGFARALRSGGLAPEERERYLDIIEKECRRLSRLSDNLLKLTSLESGHQPVHLSPYRLDRQLRSAILVSEPQWQGKQLEVEADLAELTVNADEELLSQVWLNLLHNSIKFTPPGGSIRVTAAQHGEAAVQVNVTDTGIGMSDEEREHVFERFYKADRARSREAGGSGLGLAIVKRIVDLHRGFVDVTSKHGEGSTFTVTLPRDVKSGSVGKSDSMQ
jgi:signal transduction histidine kinase